MIFEKCTFQSFWLHFFNCCVLARFSFLPAVQLKAAVKEREDGEINQDMQQNQGQI